MYSELFEEITNNDPRAFRDLIKDKKALAVFWASWCGPCRLQRDQFNASPEFARFIAEHQDVRRYAINVDNNEGIGVDYRITSIPTTIAFVNGKQKYTKVGCVSMRETMVPDLERAFA